MIFRALQQKSGSSSVAFSSLLANSGFEKDNDLKSAAKKWFDQNDVGELTEDDCMHNVEAIYRERKNLVLALNDIASVTQAMGDFLDFIIFFLMFFLVLIVFSQGSLAPVTVTLATLFVAFSFLVADTAKAMASSFVFVFIRYPFDVGDRISFDLNGTSMFVQKINLLNTTVML